jgi:hypothetical protein
MNLDTVLEPRRTRRTRRKGKAKENARVGMFRRLMIRHGESWRHRFANNYPAFDPDLFVLRFLKAQHLRPKLPW